MKTPLLKDLGALRRCNPPTFRLPACAGLWPAIDKRSLPGFQCNLMSIPIEPARPLSDGKDKKKNANYQRKKQKNWKSLIIYALLSLIISTFALDLL
jgi:hypothetical protein